MSIVGQGALLNGEAAATDFNATGLQGARGPGRAFVGGAASGPPISGTYRAGDFVIDQERGDVDMHGGRHARYMGGVSRWWRWRTGGVHKARLGRRARWALKAWPGSAGQYRHQPAASRRHKVAKAGLVPQGSQGGAGPQGGTRAPGHQGAGGVAGPQGSDPAHKARTG